MQTTLLGLAIAIILALVAALVGPLLIDWGSHRLLFEAEASRLIGVNVRVAGRIDARLLPSPRLTLHDIEIGSGGDAVRARSLGIEFSLGPLMRGEWRAAEIHFVGPQLGLGLDASGHARAPNLAVAFKPDELAVDRLSVEDGKIILSHAANGASITLEHIGFNGEARSLAGPAKGDGSATVGGRLYQFRIVMGRMNEEGAFKLHANVDPADRSTSIEADGTLVFAASEPHFEGTLNLSQPVGLGPRDTARPTESLTQPWRASAKVNATGQSALMQDVEFQYGSEEQGLRLTGIADFKFGVHPHIEGVLSGRQIDIGRAISNIGETRPTPAAAIRKIAELGTGALRPALPIQIGIGIDQLTLGANTVQNLRADISGSADGWSFDRLEFRAPGVTQVRLSGRLAPATGGIAFSGPVEIDASDPKMLTAWLEGRSGGTSQGELTRPLSLRGELTLGAEKIAVERFRAEFDRKSITGRMAYIFPSGSRPATLDAELKAPVLDVDAAVGFAQALLAGTSLERPRQTTLAAEIGIATIGGIQAHDTQVRATLDDDGLRLDRLSVADFGGASFAASGRIKTGKLEPRGNLSINLETKKAAAIVAMIEKFAPKSASPAKSLLERVRHAKLHAGLDIDNDGKSATVAQLALAGDLDEMRVDVHARMAGEWTKPYASNLRIDGTIDAPAGALLMDLLGLDRFVAVGKGPGRLKVQAAGPVNEDMSLDARLSAGGLVVEGSGHGQFSGDQGAKLAATLQVAEADLRPLRQAAGVENASPLPLRLKSHVAIANGVISFDHIDAKAGDSGIRGHFAISGASPRRIDGALEADSIDGPALVAWGIGLPAQGADSQTNWSSEPFGAGAFGKFSGKVELKLAQAALLPRLTARDLNATLRLDENEIALDDASGHLAGGRLSGAMSFRRAEDGLTTRARVSLTGLNAAALVPAAAGRPPVDGSLGLTAEVNGAGLSPIALVGALKGSGKIVLVDGQISGLDPRALDAVIRAVDQGLPIENRRIADLVGKSLEAGPLPVKHAEAAISVAAGQLRFDNVNVESTGATLSVAGTLDLADVSINSRLTLSGQGEVAGTRPNILVTLKGPLAAPTRSIDVSALVGWLTLRSVEDHTKRLHAIENMPSQPRGRPTPKSRQAPTLPAPIDIQPLPAPRSAGQPAGSVDSRN